VPSQSYPIVWYPIRSYARDPTTTWCSYRTIKLKDLINTCNLRWMILSYAAGSHRILSYPIPCVAGAHNQGLYLRGSAALAILKLALISYPILSHRILFYPRTKEYRILSYPIPCRSTHTTKAFTLEVRRPRTRYTQTCAHLLTHANPSYPILSYLILSSHQGLSHPILSDPMQAHTTKAFALEVRRPRTRYTQTCAHLISHPILSLTILSYLMLS
jgi:hypothetical protein